MASDANNQGQRFGMPSAFMAANGAPHDVAAARGIHYPAAHHDGLGGLVSHFGALGLANNNLPQGAAPVAMPPSSYMPVDASVMYNTAFGSVPAPLNMGMQAADPLYGGGVPAGHFVPQGGVPSGYNSYMIPYTPGRATSFGDRIDRGLRDVPGLDNRRGSYSTTATESTPGTPFFGAVSDRHNAPRVLSAELSSYTTPSPQQLGSSGMIGPVTAKVKRISEPELRALVEEDPQIPAAVPAVFTTPEQRKTLDQCLENRIEGNKNVYIRGLHPTTDDELLSKYASRFGEVEQSKAIIDTATGACKGQVPHLLFSTLTWLTSYCRFGFAKFKDVRDSEKCIQGFYLLGYEVGFARESFNARLKAEGDDGSTNLYISNLPKSVTEAQLVAIFDPYQILSSKILRDSMGNSRGVGFARFESREVCEEVIKRYHCQAIGDECFLMQVRYADTPAQKELKRITAERRQYRTNEYNIGAYGTMAVGINPSIYSTQSTWGRSPRLASAAPGGTYRPALAAKSGNANMMQDRVPQQSAITASSDDGSADEGVTVVDSPTNCKSQSSPIVKKEAA
ncbi:Sporulation-specific protein 5 [Cytospora mali]|uniref:Sporulation-specific protein 5 n=1 Tax=Cytospora mali TaxID=578113 RepID=A0A194UU35_CYTMA|nr:Sporulation-specific protein 5 [Valsa mali var. pyri (nom. inval.)]